MAPSPSRTDGPATRLRRAAGHSARGQSPSGGVPRCPGQIDPGTPLFEACPPADQFPPPAPRAEGGGLQPPSRARRHGGTGKGGVLLYLSTNLFFGARGCKYACLRRAGHGTGHRPTVAGRPGGVSWGTRRAFFLTNTGTEVHTCRSRAPNRYSLPLPPLWTRMARAKAARPAPLRPVQEPLLEPAPRGRPAGPPRPTDRRAGPTQARAGQAAQPETPAGSSVLVASDAQVPRVWPAVHPHVRDPAVLPQPAWLRHDLPTGAQAAAGPVLLPQPVGRSAEWTAVVMETPCP